MKPCRPRAWDFGSTFAPPLAHRDGGGRLCLHSGFVMTREEYLQLLAGFEAQLRRHSDPWGNLELSPLAQELRRSWETTAAAFQADYPDMRVPAPFWVRETDLTGTSGTGLAE